MNWSICLGASLAILFAACLYAAAMFRKYKAGQLLTPFKVIFIGVFLSVFVAFIPVFQMILTDEPYHGLKVVLFDLLQTIQVFTVNVGGEFILDNISNAGVAMTDKYSSYVSVLFLIAPLLTFGFLASLFKNALSTLVYRLHFWGDVYVFSELNEKSLLLAKSIRENHKYALIVFNNVDREEGEISSEYLEGARELAALTFEKDVVSVDFSCHSKNGQICFFVIGEKEGENLVQALKLSSAYNDREHTRIYVFSTGAEGELLLSNLPKGKVKIRRVNEVRSMVYRYLYNEGCEIFESALEAEDGLKQINAVVIGLGKTGTEMLKALSWYCQMDGYTVNLQAYDKNELALEKFTALCPELMSEKYNGVRIPGESEYTICIHPKMDATTSGFMESFRSVPQPTYIFVCLGDDEDNINCAANLRMLSERRGAKPIIRTVVYSEEGSRALKGICNFSGQAYAIDTLGDLVTSFSEDTLMESELEQLALSRHLKWGKEEEFWQYEYNYRSSMASAIHMQARIACAIPGAGKTNEELTPGERDTIEQLEHRRWNTYMRSEGYIYSGSPEKSSRNNLAKMHHDLVDFDSLTEEEKRKDSSVGSL